MLTFTFILITVVSPQFVHSNVNPKIAIIGGGIGGTSCAYFLRELFQDKASISLFEKDTVGGRLRLMSVDNHEYEAGGAVIHPRNQYMVKFSRLLGLGLHHPHSTSMFGLYNGNKFVFKSNEWYILTVADLIWRYGLSTFRLLNDVKSMLDDFSRIYNLQDQGYSYTSVDYLLNSMNPAFTNMTRSTISDILLEKGYSQIFVDEFVQSVMMVNYGQTNNMSGFAGYVSLAGAENNLLSVDGGNKLVPEGLLKLSKAHFVESNVVEIELLSDEMFSVKYEMSSPDEPMKTQKFDIVVLSAPLITGQANIKFVNFQHDFRQFERPYHQTVSTFVKGTLNPSAFYDTNSLPEDILTFNDSLLFNSIGKCSPAVSASVGQNGDGNVYKVFSQKPLSKESIQKLFENVDAVEAKIWLAYPHYKPPEAFVPFVLHPGLYYTNAVELSASAMEMSAISAKNVALLIFNSWKNSLDRIDPQKTVLKDEL